MSDEERCRRAHYIINNDGGSDVEGALRDIWVKIDRGGCVKIKLFRKKILKKVGEGLSLHLF